jgi:hypothetical protein
VPATRPASNSISLTSISFSSPPSQGEKNTFNPVHWLPRLARPGTHRGTAPWLVRGELSVLWSDKKPQSSRPGERNPAQTASRRQRRDDGKRVETKAGYGPKRVAAAMAAWWQGWWVCRHKASPAPAGEAEGTKRRHHQADQGLMISERCPASRYAIRNMPSELQEGATPANKDRPSRRRRPAWCRHRGEAAFPGEAGSLKRAKRVTHRRSRSTSRASAFRSPGASEASGGGLGC